MRAFPTFLAAAFAAALAVPASAQTGFIGAVKASTSVFAIANPTTGVVTEHDVGAFLPGTGSQSLSILSEPSVNLQRRWLIGGAGFIGRVTFTPFLQQTIMNYAVVATGSFTARFIGRDSAGDVLFVDLAGDQVLRMNPAGTVSNVTTGTQPWGTSLNCGVVHPVSGEVFVGTIGTANAFGATPARIFRFLPGQTAPALHGHAAVFFPGTQVSALAIDPFFPEPVALVEDVGTLTGDRLLRVSPTGQVADVVPPASFNAGTLAVDQSGGFVLGLVPGTLVRVANAGGPFVTLAVIPNIPAQSSLRGLSVQGALAPAAALPLLSVTAPAPGAVDFDLFTFRPPGDSFRVLVSFQLQSPTGSGPVFGVGPDALSQLFSPVIFGVTGASGRAHLGFTGVPAGITADLVALDITPQLTLAAATNVVPFTTL